MAPSRGHSVRIQGGIKTGAGRITVYYSFALVALTEFVKSDVFEDEDGARLPCGCGRPWLASSSRGSAGRPMAFLATQVDKARFGGVN